MSRLLFLDTETGGIDPNKYSLLTIGLVVWDKSRGILYKNEVCQKLAEYNICDEALNINQFDISKFSEKDILTANEIIDIFNFLKLEYFEGYSAIPLAGHNIGFDIDFLKLLYEKEKKDFEKDFSYKTVDTFSILQYLIHMGKLPENINNSTKAFEFFNIIVNGRHTALGDSIATAELYSKLLSFGTKTF